MGESPAVVEPARPASTVILERALPIDESSEYELSFRETIGPYLAAGVLVSAGV